MNLYRRDVQLKFSVVRTTGRLHKVSCFFSKKCVTAFCLIFLLMSSSAHASYSLVDGFTGRVLEENNGDVKQAPASITKIWTVYVAIQEANIHDVVSISQLASQQEGSSVYLKYKENWSLESLLYGTMLQSGNDAAFAISEHVGGSEAGFVHLMNAYAKQAGVKNTWFMNASGLHHPKHMTTANDMAKLFHFALQDPVFKQIASTESFRPKERNAVWVNKHRLVKENRAIAGKTGYTSVAGRTLATLFEDDEKQLIVVTLNESNDWQLHQQIVSTGFQDTTKMSISGDYLAPGGIWIRVNTPFHFLQKKDETVEHRARLSPSSNKGKWEIQIGGSTLSFDISYTME